MNFNYINGLDIADRNRKGVQSFDPQMSKAQVPNLIQESNWEAEREIITKVCQVTMIGIVKTLYKTKCSVKRYSNIKAKQVYMVFEEEKYPIV